MTYVGSHFGGLTWVYYRPFKSIAKQRYHARLVQAWYLCFDHRPLLDRGKPAYSYSVRSKESLSEPNWLFVNFQLEMPFKALI